jgi:glutathione S-transferase
MDEQQHAGDAGRAEPGDGRLLTLYQAEWCPFSAAVREVLTELGLDVVLRQVEPQPEQRTEMREATGTDSIPVLVSEDGGAHRGTRAIFAHLHERDPGRFAAAHRRRYAEHREARETEASGKLIERFRSTAELEAVEQAAARR